MTIVTATKKLISQTDIEGLTSVDRQRAVDDVISRWRNFLKSIRKRYDFKDIFEEHSLNQLDERDLKDLLKLSLVIEKISQILSMPSGLMSEEERNLLTTFLRVIQKREIKEEELINNFIESIEREIESLSRETLTLERDKDDRERELINLESQSRASLEKEKLLPAFYPPSENLIIAYATQFTFDPDFREFLRRVAEIERGEFILQDGLLQNDERQRRLEDKKRKGQKIQELCQLIFPKLEAYLIYIFEGGDYPLIRLQSVFA